MNMVIFPWVSLLVMSYSVAGSEVTCQAAVSAAVWPWDPGTSHSSRGGRVVSVATESTSSGRGSSGRQSSPLSDFSKAGVLCRSRHGLCRSSPGLYGCSDVFLWMWSRNLNVFSCFTSGYPVLSTGQLCLCFLFVFNCWTWWYIVP